MCRPGSAHQLDAVVVRAFAQLALQPQQLNVAAREQHQQLCLDLLRVRLSISSCASTFAQSSLFAGLGLLCTSAS